MRRKFSWVFLLLLTFSLWAVEGEKAKNPDCTGNLWYSVRTIGYLLGYVVGEIVDNQVAVILFPSLLVCTNQPFYFRFPNFCFKYAVNRKPTIRTNLTTLIKKTYIKIPTVRSGE